MTPAIANLSLASPSPVNLNQVIPTIANLSLASPSPVISAIANLSLVSPSPVTPAIVNLSLASPSPVTPAIINLSLESPSPVNLNPGIPAGFGHHENSQEPFLMRTIEEGPDPKKKRTVSRT